mmetsp:Transcript_22335/g.48798  ORF Transcript_22335/g.48798 Transcript_22335/m.48798 type:complete len:369 (+) Transcript_22335:1355-2461(+)
MVVVVVVVAMLALLPAGGTVIVAVPLVIVVMLVFVLVIVVMVVMVVVLMFAGLAPLMLLAVRLVIMLVLVLVVMVVVVVIMVVLVFARLATVMLLAICCVVMLVLVLVLVVVLVLAGLLRCLGCCHRPPVLPLGVELGHYSMCLGAKHHLNGDLALCAGDDSCQGVERGHNGHQLGLLLLIRQHISLIEHHVVRTLHLLYKQVHHRAEVAPLTQVRAGSQGGPAGVLLDEAASINDSDKGVQLQALHERVACCSCLVELVTNVLWLSHTTVLQHNPCVWLSTAISQGKNLLKGGKQFVLEVAACASILQLYCVCEIGSGVCLLASSTHVVIANQLGIDVDACNIVDYACDFLLAVLKHISEHSGLACA